MKTIIIFLLLIISNLLVGQAYDPDSIYTDPEFPAQFIYSEEELNSFISNNVIVPFEARFYGINGDVELKYVIDTMGKIADVSLIIENIDLGNSLRATEKVKSDDFKGFFSNEGIRVVLLLSDLYRPATDYGSKVNSARSITLTFRTKQYDQNEHDFRVLQGNRAIETFNWNYGSYTRDNPDYSLDRYNHGVIKLQENKPELACKYFEEAIRLNDAYIDAYYNLGLTYLKLSRIDDACNMWEKANQLGDEEAGYLSDKYCHQ